MLTYANQLTILRMAFVPVFILLLVYQHVGGAIVVFLLAGLTDVLDGLIARRMGQKTPLGTTLDPVADKLLLVSSFIVLSLDSIHLQVRVPLWLTVTVVSRDLLLVLGALVINLTLGRRIFYPSIFGKATTFAQLLTVFAVLLSNLVAFVTPIVHPLIYITLLLTIVSGVHYLARGMRVFEYNKEVS
jgi:cardiolipin synthase (CMP-forming)